MHFTTIPNDPATYDTANLKFLIGCMQNEFWTLQFMTGTALQFITSPDEEQQEQWKNDIPKIKTWLEQANKELDCRPDKETAVIEIVMKDTPKKKNKKANK